MPPKKTTRTPRKSDLPIISPSVTPQSARRSQRGTAAPSTPVKRPASEPSSPETLRGKTSPYFKDKRKLAASRSNTSKSAARGKVSIKSSGKNGKKVKKDPEDVTGLTSTEEELTSEPEGVSEDDFAPSSADDEAVESDEEEEEEEGEDSDVDSDDLDGEASGSKRKRKGGTSKTKASANGSAKKNKGKVKVEGYEDEEDDYEVELEEGQEVAGRIYPAPKTGQVPPGRISQNTLNFLKNLQIPERNDRDWFRSHEPAFRQAEKEWQTFVGLVQLKFHEADSQIPILPPKDLIHRIYRDVRFSSDKTPYKRSFSLSTSRSGRKGLWAGYHLSLCPNDKSIIAAGVWCPGKNEMATIRHHLLSTPEKLRDVIEEDEFVHMFGKASPGKKGERRNVFGHEDALKVAPKGIDKGHKDIDLLKLRSVAVVKHFTDTEVLDPNFQDTVKNAVEVMKPLVHILNDFIALPP